MVATSERGIVIATIGRYHDKLRKEAGRWRISERVLVMAGEKLPEGAGPTPPC